MINKKVVIHLFVFFVMVFMTSNVYADIPKKSIQTIVINGFNMPQYGGEFDTSVDVSKTHGISVSKMEWYKDNERLFENVANEEGRYCCRIYLDVNEDYYIPPNTLVILNNYNYDKSTEVKYSEMAGKSIVMVNVNVKKPTIKYPTSLSFSGFRMPIAGKKPGYKVTSKNPSFYEVNKVEWYRDSALMDENETFIGGIYRCRIYLDFYQDFNPTDSLIIYIGSSSGRLIVGNNVKYVEASFDVIPLKDEKLIEKFVLNFITVPSYGLDRSQIKIEKYEKTNKYYDIDRIEWYKNENRMLETRFVSGNYKARIFFKLLDGGYVLSNIKAVDISSNNKKYTCYKLVDEYYIDVSYTISEPVIKKFEFYNLNVPVYGGIQDNRVSSYAPGMYTPSNVIWYNKNNIYMSNVDRYQEGAYICKFTVNVNSECKVHEDMKATINGEEAYAHYENGKVTIEKKYNVNKSEKMWTKNSSWFDKELEDALNNNLIPDILNQKDYTLNVTREEFAEVAVKMYEQLSYKIVEPIDDNPFVDTNNPEVVKAYHIGITQGTASDMFSPNKLITREEMVTMMVRAINKAQISTSVDMNRINKFSDHNEISSWALNGVYFMSSTGIVKGVGNNTFNVKGNATRDEAIALSIRTVNKYR